MQEWQAVKIWTQLRRNWQICYNSLFRISGSYPYTQKIFQDIQHLTSKQPDSFCGWWWCCCCCVAAAAAATVVAIAMAATTEAEAAATEVVLILQTSVNLVTLKYPSSRIHFLKHHVGLLAGNNASEKHTVSNFHVWSGVVKKWIIYTESGEVTS